MMKDLYIRPEVDFKVFDVLDIIATSGTGTSSNDDDENYSGDHDLEGII